jgi:branched-chain amino acid transport system substrate-binding protein
MNLSVKALSVSLAAALAMIACSKEAPPPPPAAAPAPPPPLVVTIGHAAPLTGPQAHLGKDNENGAVLAIEDANAAKLKFGGRNVVFKLMSEDDQADPRQATLVAQKFVDAKVNAVVGHLNSGTTIPASKIYNDAGIPEVSPSATNPTYTHQGFKTASTPSRTSRRRPSPSSTTRPPTAKASPASSRRPCWLRAARSSPKSTRTTRPSTSPPS